MAMGGMQPQMQMQGPGMQNQMGNMAPNFGGAAMGQGMGGNPNLGMGNPKLEGASLDTTSSL